MKRLVSVLLVAMLIVASMCVTAFAVEVEAGSTSVTVPVTVNGPVGACKVQVSGTDVLTITGISGDPSTTINHDKGIVVWSSAQNVDSYTFYVTVDVSANAVVGETYFLNVSVVEAAKKVSAEEDTDGVADGWMRCDTSASGSVTIVCNHTYDQGTVTTPATCEDDGVMTYTCTKCGETKTEVIPATGNHTWSDWTVTKEASCTAEGEKTRSCSVCGAVEHEAIPMIDHNYVWEYDDIHHWLTCSVCGHDGDKEAHDHNIEGGDGYYYCECGHKGDKIPVNTPVDDPNKDDVPKTGDITMQVTLGGVAIVVAMLASVAYVFKRKTAK